MTIIPKICSGLDKEMRKLRKKYFKYLFLIGFIIFSNNSYASQIIDTNCFLSMVPYEGTSDNVKYIKFEESRPIIDQGRTLITKDYRIICWVNQFPIVKGDSIGILAQPSMGLVGVKKLIIRIAGAEIKTFDYNARITEDFSKSMYFVKFDTNKLQPGFEYMIEAVFETDNGKRRAASQLYFRLVNKPEDPQAQAVAQAIAQATENLANNYQQLLKKYSDDQKIYQEKQKQYEVDLATVRAEATSNSSSQPRVEVREVVKEVKVVDNSKINELSNRLAQLEKENSNLRNQKIVEKIVEKVVEPKNIWTGVFSVKGNGTATVHYDWVGETPTTRTVDFKNYMVCSGLMLPCTLTVTLDGKSITRKLENKDKANYYCFDFSGN